VKPNVEGTVVLDSDVYYPVETHGIGAGTKKETWVNIIQISMFAYVHAIESEAPIVAVAFVSILLK